MNSEGHPLALPEDLAALSYSSVVGVLLGIKEGTNYFTHFDRNAALANDLEALGYIRAVRADPDVEPKYRDYVLTEKGEELAQRYKAHRRPPGAST